MKFFVTFGQQYRQEKHPIFGGIHPDGYIIVESENKEHAILIVEEVFKQEYSNIYTEEEISNEKLKSYFPIGNLKTINAKNFQDEDLWDK